RQLLRLAQLTPVPDLSVFVSVVDDQSPPGPPRAVASLQVGVPVPFFDRNQGAIYQAQSNLVRASEEPHRVRADLTGRLAEAFERYQSNRALVAMYAREIIPNQVRAFRAVLARHNVEGGEKGVTYLDLVTAEQALVGVITTYLGVLRDQWTAVV